MTDTNINITPTQTTYSGPQWVYSDQPLFVATDVGRLISLHQLAPNRVASTTYDVGTIFVSSYAQTNRIYRVLRYGATAAANMAGTVPNYDLNAPNDVSDYLIDGSLILKYIGAGANSWGWGTITFYRDPQSVVVNVDPTGPFCSTSPTQRWRLGEFSSVRGYPRCGTFHKGRLWMMGSITKPSTIWSTETGDFTSMSDREPDGTVLDTNAITETVDDNELNTIVWCQSVAKGLMIGTEAGEFLLNPTSTTTGLSPSNVDVARQQGRGSSDLVPGQRVGAAVLFVQRGNRAVRELQYDFYTDSFLAPDLSQLSDHITGPGIVDAAYQEQPIGIWWLVRSDGVLVSVTYDREQKVRAWTKHVMAGSYSDGSLNVSDPIVESVAVVPSPDGATDDVYVSVLRTLNGVTARTIEIIRAPYRADIEGDTAGFFVDCGLTYSGPPALMMSGLDHLEGETVWICADGTVRQNQLVVKGQVNLTGPAAALVHVGLPYKATLTTMPIPVETPLGTGQGKFKRVHEVIVMLLESMGGRVGRAPNIDPLIYRTTFDATDGAVPLFTGDKRIAFAAGWDRDGTVTIEHNDPLPFTCLAIVQELVTNG